MKAADMEHLSTASTGDQGGRATATMLPTVAIPAATEPATTGTGGGPTSRPTRRSPRGGRHRRAVAAAAALAVVALVGVLLARDENAAGRPATAAPVPTSPAPRGAEAPATATPVPAPRGESTPATPKASPAPAPDVSTSPTSPADGASVFDAWLQGNNRLLRELTIGPVADFLAARTPHEAGQWTSVECEGAAGSSYCAWTHPDAQIVIRFSNVTAEGDGQPAGREAFFVAPPGGVAVWPFTTAQQAARTQAEVDAGHQPWLLDPATVVGSYAEAELGWHHAGVEELEPGSYRVTDPASGARVQLTLAQPARQGPSGIWAVVRAGST